MDETARTPGGVRPRAAGAWGGRAAVRYSFQIGGAEACQPSGGVRETPNTGLGDLDGQSVLAGAQPPGRRQRSGGRRPAAHHSCDAGPALPSPRSRRIAEADRGSDRRAESDRPRLLRGVPRWAARSMPPSAATPTSTAAPWARVRYRIMPRTCWPASPDGSNPVRSRVFSGRISPSGEGPGAGRLRRKRCDRGPLPRSGLSGGR